MTEKTKDTLLQIGQLAEGVHNRLRNPDDVSSDDLSVVQMDIQDMESLVARAVVALRNEEQKEQS